MKSIVQKKWKLAPKFAAMQKFAAIPSVVIRNTEMSNTA
jgi:hypothetical protein